MNKHLIELPTQLPITYFYEKHGSQKLLIFLHGYTDSASAFLRRAFDQSSTFDILAPNAPFPVPVRGDQGFKEAYSWYFEEHSTQTLLIPKKVTVQILKDLITSLDLVDQPKIIIGFSQGGFLAPVLAHELKNVEKIIGIGCSYREESYAPLSNVKVYGIHGSEDSIVDFELAAVAYDHLNANIKAGWTAVEGMHHTMNEAAKLALLKYISS
jgi:predicted esterase